MASRGGWKDGRPPSLERAIRFTRADLLKVGALVASDVRDRAFPSTGAGRDEDGRPYPGYSTKRLYVSKASPPRPADMPAPRGDSGKRGRGRGLTSKNRKTVRYDGGYSQYRASIGRSSGANKNLTLTGQTGRALAPLRVDPARNLIVIGFRTRRERAVALDAEYQFMGLTSEESATADRLGHEELARKLEAWLTRGGRR
jgi:hypothetical protein